MPETIENVRRWNGYVCPDCRFVFRVARDHDGNGVVCPSCRRVLRIPAPEDSHPPLVIPLPPSKDPAKRRSRRRRRSRHGESEHWERENAVKPRHHKQDTRQMRWLLSGGALLLSLCVVAVLYAMRGTPAPGAAAPVAAPAAAEPLDATAISDNAFLAEARPLAERFLAATRVEELLPLVREPERAEPRIRAHYPDGRIEPEGLDDFNTRALVLREGPFLMVNVRTRDYQEKSMGFINTPDGLKIDWESWAGWSAMTWEDFLSAKPASPTLFRVILKPVDYYNFGFSDDTKWRSYRLDSPDGEHSLYGYVERGTVTDSLIQPPPEQKTTYLTVYLRFPEGGESRNQVLIERLAAERWLIENEDSP